MRDVVMFAMKYTAPDTDLVTGVGHCPTFELFYKDHLDLKQQVALTKEGKHDASQPSQYDMDRSYWKQLYNKMNADLSLSSGWRMWFDAPLLRQWPLEGEKSVVACRDFVFVF